MSIMRRPVLDAELTDIHPTSEEAKLMHQRCPRNGYGMREVLTFGKPLVSCPAMHISTSSNEGQ